MLKQSMLIDNPPPFRSDKQFNLVHGDIHSSSDSEGKCIASESKLEETNQEISLINALATTGRWYAHRIECTTDRY